MKKENREGAKEKRENEGRRTEVKPSAELGVSRISQSSPPTSRSGLRRKRSKQEDPKIERNNCKNH